VSASPAAAPFARLNVTDRLGPRVVSLDKMPFTIGRGDENDLTVSGREVSRTHAEIVRDGDAYVLHDRSSRYGTFVGGELKQTHLLVDGDRIRLGRSAAVELIFLLEPEEQPGGSLIGIVRQTAALLEGLRALGAGHLLQDVLALVLDAAIEVSGAERGFIMLAGPAGGLELMLGRARGRITLDGQFQISQKIPDEVFATGDTRIVADLIDGELSEEHQATVALGIRQVLCVPLRLMRYLDLPAASEERRRIGVLYLDSRERGALLSTTTKLGVETLAAEAAVAIENARLYREALEKARVDQELRIAADMQRALRPPGVYSGADFTIAATTRSSRSIGGDFFDYVELGEGAVGIAVGDVAGKGPPAAVLAAAVQGMFAAYASGDAAPGETLARVNTTLARHFVENRFATMVYLIVWPGGRLTYSVAGHNPPMLFGEHSVRRLTAGGLPLGLFPDASFPSETIQLGPSDIVVCFSDGISEASNASEDYFGDERIIETVRVNARHEAPALLEDLLTAVHDFTGDGVAQDDMTALVLRRQG
jgi:sigma-B regulation protein RsbU (phosphoserine phosphatase)